jgi:peptide/nickel transport system substrate-binding protein
MAFLRGTDGWRMKRPGFRLAAVVGAVLLVGVTAGAAAAGKAKPGATKPVLRIGMAADIITLNPLAAPSGVGPTNTFYSLAYAPLIHQLPNGKFAPALARSWRYFTTGRGNSKDFELVLRHDAKFSDGSPVTASAIVDDLTAYTKGTGAFATWLGPNPVYTAVGKYKVHIHLTIPTPGLPYILSDGGLWGWIVSPAASANQQLATTTTYGAGPYMLDPSKSVRGDHYTFVPNPYYYAKKAIKYSEVDVRVISNPSSMLQAMQSGQLDVASGDGSVAAAAKSAGLKVLSASYGVQYGTINILKGPSEAANALKDVRVRQALNYALDRKALVKAILFGYGKPTSSFEPIDSNPKLQNAYPYNPAKAKALLKAAGYGSGFPLKIACFAAPSTQGLVEALAKYWQDVGIQAQYTCTGVIGTYIQQILSLTSVGSLAQLGQPTPQLFNTFIGPKAPARLYGDDGTLYNLFYSGLRSKNPTADWTKMWTRITKQAYYIPFYESDFVYFIGPHVTGVTTSNGRLGTILPLEWSPK